MSRKRIQALTVRQWLPEWDDVKYSVEGHRRKPPESFLLFSLDASEVRRLAGIQRRLPEGPRASDQRIQREHEPARSQEIAEYIRYGFPWSSLTIRKRSTSQFEDLKKPGWLPTAVVLNILTSEDTRDNQSVHKDDLITVESLDDGTAVIELPDALPLDWELSGELAPLEVIDGQHRLWAFDTESRITDYQLPIVAFHGLDRSWQAYLFYTINIKPKRINSSLAFDLYPLLRSEEWLQRFDDNIYRTTRAQEITEALWSHPMSPWYQRIDMLGSYRRQMVTQNSWVRTLQTTMIKSWSGSRVQIGGLFGAPVGQDELVLPWSRAQQAAFLIVAWKELATEITKSTYEWALSLRDAVNGRDSSDPAFSGAATLLNLDMGVRGYLYMLNDLCFVRADRLSLHKWRCSPYPATAEQAVTEAIESLYMQEAIIEHIRNMSEVMATFDWRSSNAKDLDSDERRLKARFRGSTGYRELRIELLQHLTDGDGELALAAQKVAQQLGYDAET